MFAFELYAINREGIFYGFLAYGFLKNLIAWNASCKKNVDKVWG